jgi:alkylation response protein AidB-like acyl-CoA dehydrogenase
MAEAGLMGLNIPEEYGGSGMDEVCRVLAISEVAKACASTAEILSVHLLTNTLFMDHGTEEQKKKYLAWGSSGKVGAFALTEPGAGSDASAARTKAESDGDYYVINGCKCFISNTAPKRAIMSPSSP